MNNRNFPDEFFQRPLNLPDSEAMTAQIMQKVVRAERQRKTLLVGSGVVGTSVAVGVVWWANALSATSSGVLSALESVLGSSFGSFIARLDAQLDRLIVFESPSHGFGLWMLTAASLIAMGVAAVRSSHES